MKSLTLATLLITLFTPLASIAADSQQDIEHMSVTYRSPMDYAIYQYTTHVFSMFKLQLRADIHIQARMSSLQMAQEQGVIDNTVSTEQQKTIPVRLTRAIKAAD
ncbi:hypothetical protein CXF83_06930 [Shewanella sp. Choline-02u-19]|uniref:hypothetical protein n=1 Tax=unclassified Shewanella TaxID=196818 RepID=UPI000C34B933|nr:MULTISPECIES: hypothetical protein [unclassified Shewanella]PKG55838.1 hypothetical protein CXF82_17905 [Shewanella sp. GutDb-MelDb]PKG75177.1 hypothetical protein CXF86_09400 [Shewanella sp. GutCb]PKH58428.1 hypothetical protein CXF84_05220 [Shewanella sp. Bg11-22]PKI26501.1 hypothetical protein CXF83_06930 [Shewanella sp. Choline-02u-19]